MRQNKFKLLIAASVAVLVAACGGNGGSGNLSPKIHFSSEVVFGDSLSDVGSYAVDGVASRGGGRYTVNSTVNGVLAKTNWTELMATTLQLPEPCPAETGLNGLSAYGFSVRTVFNTPACTSYAMGGAMVTYAFGPGNANTGPVPNGNPYDGSAILGQLTVPVVTQIQNHLNAHGGSFTGKEVVFLLAGGNDAIFNTLAYLDGVEAAFTSGGASAALAQAAAAGPVAVQAMATAGQQLAGYINNMIVANGAKYVVVVYLPDLSTTPFGVQANAAFPGTQALINTMVTTFNNQLTTGVLGENVLLVDAYTVSREQIASPAAFGLTNVTATACNLSPSANPFGSSLFCNASNVIPGDISHYLFADQVHPTPYGNVLLARYVAEQMAVKGWL